MELICLGSGSKGNCYILQNNEEALILEAGLRLDCIKRGFKYQVGKIVGTVVSHEHKDHSLSVGGLLSMGIHTYGPEEVMGGIDNSFFHAMRPFIYYQIGGFKVMAIPAKHDVRCYAYILEHADMGRLLFVTDSVSLEYKVPGLNHVLIEANYKDEILEDNILNGIEASGLRNRLMASHMELGETKRILRGTDLTDVREIVLIHLSSRNADGDMFKAEIESATGKPCYIASKGLTIQF